MQFSLVPFAASVNVGPQNAGAMDGHRRPRLSIQENFDWSTLNDPNKRAEKIERHLVQEGGRLGRRGGRCSLRASRSTRIHEARQLARVGGDRQEYGPYYDQHSRAEPAARATGRRPATSTRRSGPRRSRQGSVEARPTPTTSATQLPSGGFNTTGIGFGDPATMVVLMFAPDEPSDRRATEADDSPDNPNASNNWRNDGTSSATGRTPQINMKKYFDVRPCGATSPQGSGPN